MNWKQLLLMVGVSAATAVGSVYVYSKLSDKENFVQRTADGKLPVNYAGFYETGGKNDLSSVDFTNAANTAVSAVVHIKTKIAAKTINNNLPNNQRRSRGGFEDLFEDFFGGGSMFGPQVIPEQRASGSGVLISEDGYIVTNNHVISDGQKGVADEITITLNNKKTYVARLIGRDPSSDLAVLKIDATKLPYLVYGDSDKLKLGQWVLAVGYPLTLETTVTAGIVSAKGRSIGINNRQSNTPIENFIQTDAAINQGNSGGALITTDGHLIGINSAIASPTGTYAGYGFAIPVNLAQKIISDLIEFGDVKRGYMGISYPSESRENERLLKNAGVKDGQGVYVLAVPTDGAAAAAGIKRGDVITSINNNKIGTAMEMSAMIAGLRPGEKVKINYIREGKDKEANLTLKADVPKAENTGAEYIGDILGLELENVSAKEAKESNIEGGVKVKKILPSGAFGKTRMEANFVITGVNGRTVNNVEELGQALGASNSGRIRLEGVYPGYDGVYSYQTTLE